MSVYSIWMSSVHEELGKPSGNCERCGARATEWGLDTSGIFYSKGCITMTTLASDYIPVCLTCWLRDDEQGLDADARRDAEARKPKRTPRRTRKRSED